MANIDDPISSKADPPSWKVIACTFAGGVVVIGAALGNIEKLLEDLLRGLMFFLTFLGMMHGSEISTLKPPEPSPPIFEYQPFHMTGTAYGGANGPITSTPNFANDTRRFPAKPAAKKVKVAANGEASTSAASPNFVNKIFHAICPKWFPLAEDVGRT